MKKKVLFFIEQLTAGGAEKILSNIVKNIDKESFEVSVLTVTDGGQHWDSVKECCNLSSILHAADYSGSLFKRLLYKIKYYYIYHAPAKRVYKRFVKEKYNTEVAFVEGFATKFIAASSNPDSKKIAWVHSDMIANAHADKRFSGIEQEIECYKEYDNIICVANGVKKSFEKKFFESEKLKVLYNPVDDREISTFSAEEINISPKWHPVLATVGRVEWQKGYFRLAKAANNLKNKGCKFEIWIVGSGSEEEKIKAYISQNSLGEYVKMIGFDTNPYKYVAKSDAFICSSFAEGFSTAATEALILEKQIFTTDCSGMDELFGEEKCGLIVDNSDEALEEMLERIVSGKINFKEYESALKVRKKAFEIKTAIKTIEEVL